IVMRIKLALACPRPTQFSDRLQPMIACPSHPTLPSGHATQAFCVATLLTGLQNPATPVHAADQLYRLACRIAVNRTVAGVHFPADSAAGAVLGIQLARHLLARAKEKGTVARASFDGRQFVDKAQPRDFHYGVLDQMMTGHDRSTIFAGKAGPVAPAPLWASVVDRAQTEWDTRWS
ncbi:MAG: phosphatase PAP2 family protein, partial [Paracoccus sp. (in: a-proteobacteria)]|nr:phosphatase PAP2 family protein [Paracoccus sp. (in: a-proteobacteria)]